MSEHLTPDGKFKSDKYDWSPPGYLPLSFNDPMAWPVIAEYARARRKVDAEFSDDVFVALRNAGYVMGKVLTDTDPPAMIPAVLSDDRLYRYVLRREWSDGGGRGRCAFVMLNPSTADETTDDPTIRRCIGFARYWGYDRLVVFNLFAWRATDSAELRKVADPVGPDNDRLIALLAMDANRVVVAWGNHGAFLGRSKEVVRMLRTLGVPLKCLGLNETGQPRHPLFQKADREPVLYEGP